MSSTIFNSQKYPGIPDNPGSDGRQQVEIPTPYTEEELNNIATEIINELGNETLQYNYYYNKCLEIFINGGYNTLFYQDVWNVLVNRIPELKENQNFNKSSISSPNVSNIWTGTMDEYEALEAYDNSTIYFITEGQI